MKNAAIALGVLIFGSIMLLPEIAEYSAKKAFEKENQNKTWAPITAYRAGKINMRFSRYDMGRRILGKTVKTFPDENWVGDAYYQIAFCYEKSGHSEKAINRYNLFMKKFPKHTWKNLAAKRIVNINANL